mmetsp:Transcript_10039/g.23381  ORF Transcript_10039/g.23381 Transcript_10039/m.23381 type:complete len:288 (+) Transcript_10039:1155-2018(+)
MMAAAGVSSLLEDRDVSAVLTMASELFRSITLDKLSLEALSSSEPDASLYALSEPCAFGDVHVFVSHSWSDDPLLKWEALQQWRSKFKAQHQGLEPRIFLDRACINYERLSDSITCLPVFLAGCNKLLVLRGPSFLQRLWCITECYVFMEMGGSLEHIELINLTRREGSGQQSDANDDAELELALRSFDARNAKCTLEEDSSRLLSVIESAFGGVGQFNEQLRAVLLQACASSQKRRQAGGTLASSKSRLQSFGAARLEKLLSSGEYSAQCRKHSTLSVSAAPPPEA